MLHSPSGVERIRYADRQKISGHLLLTKRFPSNQRCYHCIKGGVGIILSITGGINE